MKERTIEITDYCPFGCSFCSSDTTADRDKALFMNGTWAQQAIYAAHEEGIAILHISGGEPLTNPEIGAILECARRSFGRNVVVHTNLIPQIAYNARVIDGVKVHVYVTPEDADEVHVLKRIRQGREGRQPQVHCSRNWREQCECDHVIVKPDGSRAPSPCRKDAET